MRHGVVLIYIQEINVIYKEHKENLLQQQVLTWNDEKRTNYDRKNKYSLEDYLYHSTK